MRRKDGTTWSGSRELASQLLSGLSPETQGPSAQGLPESTTLPFSPGETEAHGSFTACLRPRNTHGAATPHWAATRGTTTPTAPLRPAGALTSPLLPLGRQEGNEGPDPPAGPSLGVTGLWSDRKMMLEHCTLPGASLRSALLQQRRDASLQNH